MGFLRTLKNLQLGIFVAYGVLTIIAYVHFLLQGYMRDLPLHHHNLHCRLSWYNPHPDGTLINIKFLYMAFITCD